MKIFLWILGFVVGICVPAAAALFIAILSSGDNRAAFFACLGSSLVLTMAGIAGWRSYMFLRGMALGSGVWLVLLPAIAGDCTK